MNIITVTSGTHNIKSGTVIASGRARVSSVGFGARTTIILRDQATGYAGGFSRVIAEDDCTVHASGRASVVVSGDAHLHASGKSKFVADGNAVVMARDGTTGSVGHNVSLVCRGASRVSLHIPAVNRDHDYVCQMRRLTISEQGEITFLKGDGTEHFKYSADVGRLIAERLRQQMHPLPLQNQDNWESLRGNFHDQSQIFVRDLYKAIIEERFDLLLKLEEHPDRLADMIERYTNQTGR